jgi:hypothetical protein
MTDIPDGIDLEADAASDADASLSTISKLAERQLELEQKVKDQEQTLAETKLELMEVQRNLLPAAMDEVGMRKFQLKDGSEVTIKDIMTASFPADGAIEKARGDERDELMDRRERCLDWLDAQGGNPLIKHAVIAELGKDSGELLEAVKAMLTKIGITPQTKLAIHNGSLVKFLKEKLAMSVEVPLDDFKVFIGQESKIKPAGK